MADELKCKGCDATEGIFRDGYCLNCLAAELEELAGRVEVLEAELQYEEQEKDLVLNRMAELLNEKERLEAALQEIVAIPTNRIVLMPESTAFSMQDIARRALAGDDK